MNQTVDLQSLHVQTVANLSAVNYGKNVQIGAKSSLKLNQGCGTLGGDGNMVVSSINSVADNDMLDAFSPVSPCRHSNNADNADHQAG